MGKRFDYQNYQTYQNTFTKLKPVAAFGYYGGKAKLASKIADLLDYTGTTTYIEPFGGSAAVLLNKVPHEKEVYAEKSISLCCFWRCMSSTDTAFDLIGRLYDTSCSRESFDSFISVVDKIEASGRKLDDLTAGEILDIGVACYVTVVCSRDSSGVRYSNTRFSTNDAYLKTIDRLADVADRFKGVAVIHSDAMELLNDERYNTAETLFYLDPPYTPQTTPGIYYRYNMTQKEHIRLLERIARMRCKVIISGYDTDSLYDNYLISGEGLGCMQEHFRSWRKYEFSAVTTVARNTDKQRAEVLWANFG